MAYPRGAGFDAYLAEARRGRPGVWRVIATLAALVCVQFAVVFSVAFVAALLGDVELRFLDAQGGELMLALFSLAIAPLTLAAALVWIHRRPFSGLLGVERRLNFSALALGAAAAVALSAIGLAISTGLGLVTVTPIVGYEPPWGLLALALLLIPAQAAGEELVFRGYLLQEFGARIPHALAWAAAPSAIFAALHYGESAPFENASYALSTFVFGLFAAALVWRTAGLSAAIGLHVMNNWIAILLFEPAHGVDGLGPFAISFAPGGWPLAVSLAMEAALLTAAFPILSRLAATESAVETAPGAEP